MLEKWDGHQIHGIESTNDFSLPIRICKNLPETQSIETRQIESGWFANNSVHSKGNNQPIGF